MAPFARIVVLAIGLIVAGAQAQTLGTSVGLGPDGATLGASIVGLRLGPLDLDAAAVADAPVAPRLGIDARARANLPLGLIGSVVFRSGVALSPAGTWRGTLGAEGSAGPVAFGVRLAAGTSARTRVDPVLTPDELRGATGEPPDGTARARLAVSARYRASRSVLLNLEPAVTARVEGGAWHLAGGLAVDAEFRDALLGGDAIARLRVVSATGSPRMEPNAVDVAIGLGRGERPRRRPPWSATLWLGAGAGVAPGATLDGSWRVDDATVDLVFAVEPWRRDLAPVRAALRVERPDPRHAGVRWRLRASASVDAGGAARGAIGVSARFDLGSD